MISAIRNSNNDNGNIRRFMIHSIYDSQYTTSDDHQSVLINKKALTVCHCVFLYFLSIYYPSALEYNLL